MPTTTHAKRPPAHGGDVRAVTPTVARERAHITRVIAASPIYLEWMRDKVADVVAREGARMADHGHHAIATVIAERSAGYRDGTLPVW